jgi:hypothetical protein
MNAKIILDHIFREELADLEAQRGVLEQWKHRGAAEAYAAVVAQVQMLKRLQHLTEASADDLLDAPAATAYSGLTRSALDKRLHAAESPKRWRRGDLPIQAPFSCGVTVGQGNEAAPMTQIGPSNSEPLELDVEVLTEEDVLKRAVDRSMAA